MPTTQRIDHYPSRVATSAEYRQRQEAGLPLDPPDVVCTGCGQTWPCRQQRKYARAQKLRDARRLAIQLHGSFAPLVIPSLFRR